ncbi:hypothetical protein ABZT02_09600 [Streptomyces sp. NPDC005402]|uniref:hypothetical protein n=1 Tax=Streptomyces sp. NPDC005402 TaxID=3155338 RepID=UPI0033B61664
MTSPAEFQRRFLRTDEQNTSDFQKAMDAHTAKAAQIRDRANETIERIGARRDLTPEAKRSAAAKVYKPAAEQIQQMLDQHIDKVKAHKQQLAKKAFGSDTAADPAASREARRMASQIQDADEAATMIRNAQFDGDKQLARTIAGVAFENGWHNAVDVWNADGSNDAYMRHVIDLVQMPDTNDAVWRLNVAQQYAKPMPGILDGLKPHEISRAAETDYSDGGEAA